MVETGRLGHQSGLKQATERVCSQSASAHEPLLALQHLRYQAVIEGK